MLRQIAIGLGLVCATTIVHASFMMAAVRMARARRARYGPYRHDLTRAVSVSGFAAWMFLGVIVEVLLWAGFYLLHPAITELPDFETAFYFSMVTFTAVGYGDVVLSGEWRLLASLEAANGVLILGWTAALIFYHITEVYGRRDSSS